MAPEITKFQAWLLMRSPAYAKTKLKVLSTSYGELTSMCLCVYVCVCVCVCVHASVVSEPDVLKNFHI